MGEERGWAGRLLSWRWVGNQLVTEVSRCAYYVQPARGEVLAWGMVRDLGGRRRVEVGSFASVALARAACERHATGLCRRDDAQERPPVGVAIGRARGGAPRGNRNAAKHKSLLPAQAGADKAGKGRQSPDPNYRPARCPEPVEGLDDALAAFADVVGDQG